MNWQKTVTKDKSNHYRTSEITKKRSINNYKQEQLKTSR